MAEREYHEVRKRLGDEPEDSSPYVGYSRKLLGALKEHMAFNGLEQLSWTKDLPDGARVSVASVFGQDVVKITVPRHKQPTKKEIYQGWKKRIKPMSEDVKTSYVVIGGQYFMPLPEVSPRTFIWTESSGFVDISVDVVTGSYNASYGVQGISEDGTLVAFSINYGPNRAVRKTLNEAMTVDMCPLIGSFSTGMSADGEIICGTYLLNAFLWEPFSGGTTILLPASGHYLCKASGISADGSLVVGSSYDEDYERPCYWEVGSQTATVIATTSTHGGKAYKASENGEVVVGHQYNEFTRTVFVWSKETGLLDIGNPPGFVSLRDRTSISRDGNTVTCTGYNPSDGSQAVGVWNRVTGWRLLDGPTGSAMFGASQDASIVVGSAFISSLEHPCRWDDDLFSFIETPSFVRYGTATEVVIVEDEYTVDLGTSEEHMPDVS